MHLNLSQQKLEKIYRKWCDGLPRTCVAFVLLSGQAVQFDGENFLVPRGAGLIESKNAAKAQCVSLSWMLGSLFRRLCSESLVILIADCSRSSPNHPHALAEGMATFENVAGAGSRAGGQQAQGAQLYALCGAVPESATCDAAVRGCSGLCSALALALKDSASASQNLHGGFFQSVVSRAATRPWQVGRISPLLLVVFSAARFFAAFFTAFLPRCQPALSRAVRQVQVQPF